MCQTEPVLFVDEQEIKLPWRWEICSDCDGKGGSSAYLGAFTREQLDEQGPEWCEDYMAGNFDRPCEVCGGSGKVKVVDERRCDPVQLAAYREQQRMDREIDDIHRQERLMEGGWREEGWFG